MKRFVLLTLFALSAALLFTCEDAANDPNKIGGDTELDYTEVGKIFKVSFTMPGDEFGVLNTINEDIVITERENGIITLNCKFSIDETNLKKIDTLIGTQDLSEEMKHTIVDAYLNRFNATLDTSNKEEMFIETVIKGKVTSEGIQDFIYSKGDEKKPFTLIKYNAKVGDKYTFTDDTGKKFTREIISKSKDDDYQWGIMYIKVFRIDETQPEDPMIERITYYANHKFGLVGMEMKMVNGLQPSVRIF